jgi:hypothetical protein
VPNDNNFIEQVLLFLIYGGGSALEVLNNSFSVRQIIRLNVTVMASVGRFSANHYDEYDAFIMTCTSRRGPYSPILFPW